MLLKKFRRVILGRLSRRGVENRQSADRVPLPASATVPSRGGSQCQSLCRYQSKAECP